MQMCEVGETYSYRCATLVTGERSKLDLHIQTTTLTVTRAFRLTRAVPALRHLV